MYRSRSKIYETDDGLMSGSVGSRDSCRPDLPADCNWCSLGYITTTQNYSSKLRVQNMETLLAGRVLKNLTLVMQYHLNDETSL